MSTLSQTCYPKGDAEYSITVTYHVHAVSILNTMTSWRHHYDVTSRDVIDRLLDQSTRHGRFLFL